MCRGGKSCQNQNISGIEAYAKPVIQPEKEPAKGTILVVDDEDIVRSLCQAIIERLGFDVLLAANGEEAIEIFNKNDNIICVLLDLTMPRMDGVATFNELKRLAPEVKVILSSGYNEQEATQNFTSEGLAGFIQKPYTMQNLWEALDKVLK